MGDRNRIVNVTVESNNSDDIATALRLIAKQIEDGYTSGGNRNDDSSYVYSTKWEN